MLKYTIILIADIFDLFLMIFFLTTFYKNQRKSVPYILFLAGFLGTEVFLASMNYITAGNHSAAKAILNISLGILTTFCLTFYFNTTIRNRFFVALSFQAVCAVAEMICATFILPILIMIHHIDETQLDYYIVISSKIIIFLMILMIDIFLHRKKRNYSLTYNIMILFTPILTLIITISIPYRIIVTKSTSAMCAVIFVCLTLLNVINYYLFDNLLQVLELKENQKQIKQQLDFQTTKYQQISSAYRNTRSLLHDTKKHFLYLQECINAKQYDQITDYLMESLEHLNQSYSRINTGNLVIDAFISNYMAIANQEAIGFVTNIQVVAEHIPTEDYDLCVILGNLLDNSLNATRKIPMPKPRQIEVEICTSKLEFVIHVKNTRTSTILLKHSNNIHEELYHGYGITNIKNLVNKYSGTYSCFPEEELFETIIVIPIK